MIWWILTAFAPVVVLSAVAVWRLPDGFVRSDFRAPTVLAVDLLLVAAGCVLVRARWPVAALLIAATCAVAAVMLAFELAPMVFFSLLILPAVAYRASRTQIALGAVVVVCQFLAMNTASYDYWHTPLGVVAGLVVGLIGVGLVGRTVTARWVRRQAEASRTASMMMVPVIGQTAMGDPASPGAQPVAGTGVQPFQPLWPSVLSSASPPFKVADDPRPALVGDPSPAALEAARPLGPPVSWLDCSRVAASSSVAFVWRHRAIAAVAVVMVILAQMAGSATFRPRTEKTAGVQSWGPPIDTQSASRGISQFQFLRRPSDLVASDGRGMVFLVDRSPDGELRLNGLSAGGDALWATSVGTPSLIANEFVAADHDGDVAVSFSQRGTRQAPGAPALPEQVVVVFDRRGVERWRSNLGTVASEAMSSVALAAPDRVYIGLDSWNPMPGGDGAASVAGVLALADGGTVRWRHDLVEGGRPAGQMPVIALDPAGVLYAATSHRFPSGLVVHRVGADGTEQWSTGVAMPAGAATQPVLVVDTTVDQVYVSMTSGSDLLGGLALPGTGEGDQISSDVVVAAVGMAGDVRWRHENHGLDLSVTGLAALPRGGVMVAGTVLPTLVAGYVDGRLVSLFDRLDVSGQLTQRDRYRRPGGAVPNDLAAVPDGSVIVVGGSAQEQWEAGLRDIDPGAWRIQLTSPP